MTPPITQPKVYLLVFLTLAGLTVITTGVALINLGPFNTVIALLIAVTKALLVILFFMHLRHGPPLPKVVLVGGLLWLAILVGLTLSDFLTRNWLPAPQRWNTSKAFPSAPSSIGPPSRAPQGRLT